MACQETREENQKAGIAGEGKVHIVGAKPKASKKEKYIMCKRVRQILQKNRVEACESKRQN